MIGSHGGTLEFLGAEEKGAQRTSLAHDGQVATVPSSRQGRGQRSISSLWAEGDDGTIACGNRNPRPRLRSGALRVCATGCPALSPESFAGAGEWSNRRVALQDVLKYF